MELVVRLLTPDKKGIAGRIADAVAAAGGKVVCTRLKRRMRGMSETEIDVAFPHEMLKSAILDSVGQVSGVALLGSGPRGGLEGRHG